MTETRCPLPKMARIRQTFARPRVDDMAAEMREQMQVLTPRIRPGMTVGLTVGSRGIQNILTMLEVAVQAVRGCGASPVLLAAMGSHGGGTRQGQKDVLDSLGITEERLGAPVITCDVTRAIGETPGGLVAYMLESAFGVDAIIPINRVKTHTSFKGCVSGPANSWWAWRAGRGRPVPQPWAGRTSPPAGGGHQGDPRQDARAWRGGHRRKRL
ncbi:MAG: hypothetical protein ACLTTU_08115 [Bilophila wadsworthia]